MATDGAPPGTGRERLSPPKLLRASSTEPGRRVAQTGQGFRPNPSRWRPSLQPGRGQGTPERPNPRGTPRPLRGGPGHTNRRLGSRRQGPRCRMVWERMRLWLRAGRRPTPGRWSPPGRGPRPGPAARGECPPGQRSASSRQSALAWRALQRQRHAPERWPWLHRRTPPGRRPLPPGRTVPRWPLLHRTAVPGWQARPRSHWSLRATRVALAPSVLRGLPGRGWEAARRPGGGG